MKRFEAVYENVRSPLMALGFEEYATIAADSWAQALDLAEELLREKVGGEFDLVSLHCSGEIVE